MAGMMAVTVLIFAFSSPVVAGIYTWTDARGIVHFTDAPPPDKPVRPVEVAAPVTAPMASNLQQQRRVSKVHKQVQTMLAPDRTSGAARKKTKEQRAAKQQRTCEGYRRKLARVQSQLRAGYSNNKGNSLRRKRRELSQSLSRECILR
jgi:hypothetical protein